MTKEVLNLGYIKGTGILKSMVKSTLTNTNKNKAERSDTMSLLVSIILLK